MADERVLPKVTIAQWKAQSFIPHSRFVDIEKLVGAVAPVVFRAPGSVEAFRARGQQESAEGFGQTQVSGFVGQECNMDVRFSSIRALLVCSLAVLPGSVGAVVRAADTEPPEFMHLNYSRMTADEAFEGETLLVVMTVPVTREAAIQQKVAGDPVLPLPETAAPSEKLATPLSGGEQRSTEPTGGQPVEVGQRNEPRSSGVAIRSLQTVNLFDATSAKTEDGKPLATPQSVVSTNGRRVEEQFVPLPWNVTHPPRNSFSFRHQPLYFEDPNLERCGESYGCLTEVVSIAHFAGRIPLLPYMMASDNPHKTVSALKDCPTGCSFGPNAYLPRPTVKAVAAEAAAVTGFIFVIP